MPASSASASAGVAVFDLDGTLTWRDTLLPFLAGYARRHPSRVIRLWRVVPALLGYLAIHRDRGILKSALIKIFMGNDPRSTIDAWADVYVAGLTGRQVFRPAALAALENHRAAGDRLVLLSASPDLYVPRIGKLLGFERTLCTEVRWRTDGGAARLDGTLQTPNRRGEEKSRCLAALRADYPNLRVIAYGNSDSDLPHLRLADAAVLVNANAGARRRAIAAGVAVGDWD